MESPVTGGITPLSLGELRQAILAVLIGNPHFTEEEQLLANHLTYECEDEAKLAKWLRNVRLEDVQRSLRHRILAALAVNQSSVCLDKDAHLLEMEQLLRCRLLDRHQKETVAWVANPGWGSVDRLKVLGHGYQMVLEQLGRVPAYRGYNALGDN
jgi:hypothetical protein